MITTKLDDAMKALYDSAIDTVRLPYNLGSEESRYYAALRVEVVTLAGELEYFSPRCRVTMQPVERGGEPTTLDEIMNRLDAQLGGAARGDSTLEQIQMAFADLATELKYEHVQGGRSQCGFAVAPEQRLDEPDLASTRDFER